MDLSKAFGTIDYNIFTNYITMDLGDYPINSYKNYSSNRSLQTEINGKLSPPTLINLGVPQGSIFGSLLFLINVNELPKCLTFGQAIMFADNTNFFFNNVSYTELLEKANEKLHQVDSWLTANKLILNIEKTKAITFKTRNSPQVPPNFEIKLNGNALDKVKSFRILGVAIHEHQIWKSHVELLLKKIRMSHGIIQKVKPYLNQKSFQLLYYSNSKSLSILYFFLV